MKQKFNIKEEYLIIFCVVFIFMSALYFSEGFYNGRDNINSSYNFLKISYNYDISLYDKGCDLANNGECYKVDELYMLGMDQIRKSFWMTEVLLVISLMFILYLLIKSKKIQEEK